MHAHTILITCAKAMKIASITFLTFGKWRCNYFLGAKECILQMASDSRGFGFPFMVIVYFFFSFSQMRQKILEHWKDLRREDEWSSPSGYQYSLFLRIPKMQNFPLVAATPEQ